MIRSKDSSGNVKSISATVTELQGAVASRDIPTNINDAWHAYLGDQGFTGSLDDRMFAFLASRTGIDVADVSDLYARWNGVVTGAVLYHDFANDLHVKENVDGTFEDFITFDRDSTVNGFTEGPVLTEFAVDEPAIGIIDPATGQSLGYRALAGFTNSLLWNRDLSNGVWSGSAAIAQDAVGLKGVANTAWTVTDVDGDGSRFRQEVTVPDDSNWGAIAPYIEKDNDTSRFPLFFFTLKGGTSNIVRAVRLNTKTGETSDRNNVGTTSVDVEDAGRFWRLVIALKNDSTGHTNLQLDHYPGWSDTFESDGANVAGASIVYDFGGVYLNSSIAGPPIETEGSPVSTAADDATEPLPASCQDGFVWVVHARTAPVLPDSVFRLGSINDGSADNRIAPYIGASGEFSVNIRAGSTGLTTINSGVFPGTDTDIKVAIRAVGGNYAVSVNGSSPVIDSSAGFPADLSNKIIGNTVFNERWNSTIAHDELHSDPENWSDARLQSETS